MDQDGLVNQSLWDRRALRLQDSSGALKLELIDLEEPAQAVSDSEVSRAVRATTLKCVLWWTFSKCKAVVL